MVVFGQAGVADGLGGLRVDGTGKLCIPVQHTAGIDYFDAVNHIKRAKCPVEIPRAGLGDYTCPPSGLAVYFNAIPTPKSINWVQGSRHGYVPPDPNQTFVVKMGHEQTGAESKSQNASADVK